MRVGDLIHLDDGRMRMRVMEVKAPEVHVLVEEGGQLRNGVGVHLPSGNLQLETLTAKDKQDLMFGLTAGIDYVAVSFVRSPEDVKLVREICEAWGRVLPICSKIETPQAIERLDAIVEASDAVMVARGDLGVEFPPEQVPVLQRKVLAAAAEHRRTAIVATEMLHSMVSSSRPTRAEASDVATAIFDGADATMLSGETASGDAPRARRPHDGAHRVDRRRARTGRPKPPPPLARPGDALPRGGRAHGRHGRAGRGRPAHRGVHAGRATPRGSSPTERPPVPVMAFSPNEDIRRSHRAVLGRHRPGDAEPIRDTDEMVEAVQAHLQASGMVSPGDRIVLVYGAPVSVRGRTNTVRIHQVS